MPLDNSGLIHVNIGGVDFSAVPRSVGLTNVEAEKLLGGGKDDNRALVVRMRDAACRLNDEVKGRC